MSENLEEIGENENKGSLLFRYIKENNIATFNIFQSIKSDLIYKIKDSNKLADYEKCNLIQTIGEINGLFEVHSDLEFYLNQNKGKKINNLAEFVLDFLDLYFNFNENQAMKFGELLFSLKIKLGNIFKEYLEELQNKQIAK